MSDRASSSTLIRTPFGATRYKDARSAGYDARTPSSQTAKAVGTQFVACVAAFSLWLVFVLFVAPTIHAQSTSALQGQVFDASGAVLRGATISVRNNSTGFD